MDDFVTIATFSQPIEAHIVRTRLEDEGIECFIKDEHLVSVNWLLSNAVGGVRLKVRKEDAERAALIIIGEGDDGGEGEAAAAGEAEESIRCVECGSEDVSFEKFSRRVAIFSWLLMGFPIPYFKGGWGCNSCGHRWKVGA